MDQREEFVQALVNLGTTEPQVRQFLKEKGAYTYDLNLIAHCIGLGAGYNRPLNFIQTGTTPHHYGDDQSERNYDDFMQGVN